LRVMDGAHTAAVSLGLPPLLTATDGPDSRGGRRRRSLLPLCVLISTFTLSHPTGGECLQPKFFGGWAIASRAIFFVRMFLQGKAHYEQGYPAFCSTLRAVFLIDTTLLCAHDTFQRACIGHISICHGNSLVATCRVWVIPREFNGTRLKSQPVGTGWWREFYSGQLDRGHPECHERMRSPIRLVAGGQP